MFRLQTFGGLTLLNPAGAPVATQRRRLGLLALLACGRGLSRDKLVAYLWSESPAEKARHALEQLLYSVRRLFPGDGLLGTDPLRLNLNVIGSDAQEFERALEAGSIEEAVTLYRGPFLDGFYLNDAPAFEEWTEVERSRLAGAHTRALHRLAKDAGGEGRHTLEIDCWRRLAALDPLSERTAIGLVRALAGAEDWAAALQHARIYEGLVRQELAQPPSSALTALVERMRTEHDRKHGSAGGGAGTLESFSGRFRIERQLGRGSVATVYLARDLKHDRLVALKILPAELASSTEAKRFLREISIAAGLRHPYILPLYDSGVMESPGKAARLYYVTPYVQGHSLRERLAADGRLPLERAVEIAREVAEALAHAHGQGIVHRDIKPENILFDAGHALIADFGIAHALHAASGERLSLSGVTLGTPGYMSPEQATAGSPVDGRSDVYSLGCVLYEILAGEPPFTGRTVQAILARHAADPVPPLRTVCPTVPAAVERAVVRALAKNPHDRFPNAIEFALALGTG